MSGLFLTDLADTLFDLKVNRVPGWETRSRNGEGFDGDRIEGISFHSTNEGAAADGWPSVYEQTFISDNRPNNNLYVDRNGEWWIIAAGPSNACGRGGPWRNILPKDGANRRTLSVTFANNGEGEPYSLKQQASILYGSAALWNHYSRLYDWGLETWRMFAHHEWAPQRRHDPVGPSAWTDGSNRLRQWDMDMFRDAVITQCTIMHRGYDDRRLMNPDAVEVDYATYIYNIPKESAWEIAAKVYGSGDKYPEILRENPGTWKIGDVLRIPGIDGYLVPFGRGHIPTLIEADGWSYDMQKLMDYYLFNGGIKHTFKEKDRVFIKSH